MPKFRKKPIIIDAIQITETIQIETLEGVMTGNPEDTAVDGFPGIKQVSVGDWLIRGVKGEQYPCSKEVFAASYEPAGNEALQEWERVYGEEQP